MKMTYFIILLRVVPNNRNLKFRLKFCLMHHESDHLYNFSLVMNVFSNYNLTSFQVRKITILIFLLKVGQSFNVGRLPWKDVEMRT